MFIARLLRNRNFALISSIVLGIAVGEGVASHTEPAVVPLLALIMTLSVTSISAHDLLQIKSMPGWVAGSILFNYLVTGGLILLAGWWLIDDSSIWTGLVVITAVPTAIAALPWSYILGGNTVLSLIGVTAAYLFALIATPLIMILFLGIGFFNPMELLFLLMVLVVMPLIASRILLFTGADKRIAPWRGIIINWSFFIVLFTIIGANRSAFFTEFELLGKLAAIALAASFGLSYLIEASGRSLKLSFPNIKSFILLGTMKNFGLASGILLTLFGERATIPASVMVVFFVSRTIWLSFRYKRAGW